MVKYRNKPKQMNSAPRTEPQIWRRSSWGAWIAIALLLVVGVILWAQMDQSPDNTTTSSTTTPAEGDDPAPAGPSFAPANPSMPGG